jgi:hypothetical protein
LLRRKKKFFFYIYDVITWGKKKSSANYYSRGSGGAAHRNGLGTCHSKGAAVVVEEDATTMTKFFFVRFIAKGLKVINCLFVGDEVEQSQELAVDAARGSHTRWQESHMSVLSVRGAIVANLVSSGAVK